MKTDGRCSHTVRRFCPIGERGKAFGFSLIEVTVGAFVVAMGVMALASLLPLNMQSSRKSQTQIVAHNLARQYLEWWRQQTFATLKAQAGSTMTYVDPLPGPAPTPPSPQQYGSLAGPTSEATYHTTVQLANSPVDTNLVQISVTVDWEPGGGAHSSQIQYCTQVYNASNPY